MMNKQRVEVEEYCPAANEVESSSEEKEEGGGAIKVTEIPTETTKEELFFFLKTLKKVVEVTWKKWSMIGLPKLLLSGLKRIVV